jgi:hypothetical protein
MKKEAARSSETSPQKSITLHSVIAHSTQFSTHSFDAEWEKHFTSNWD